MPDLVLGTAGHIDHGKSSLIRALTGTDPDRLAEEKERGITIELGFARLELPSGRTMGVVDVPGHEKFVRHMVAGATGIDAVLFVVAADDGVMPQTREHLAIVDLLGIDKGVVALTKADLVDTDWVDLVAEEVSALLVGTAIEGAPVVSVSSKSGQGLDELRTALDAIAEESPARQAAQSVRLPVDRVFTIAGAGTVVTGTLWSGTVVKDDLVELYPSRIEGRVRGIQVHSQGVDRAAAGHRVAINIAGLEKDDISRGDIVAQPGSLTVTDRFDARFTYLGFPDDDKGFESGSRVHVHHGTREVLGRVLLIDAEELRPGTSSLAQIRLEEPLAPRYEDRFIVRSYSPVYTIGGGVILDASPPRRTVLKPHERDLLDALLERDVSTAALGLLATRGVPMTSADAASAIGVSRAEVADQLNRAELERFKVGSDTYFVTSDGLAALAGSTDAALRALHDADPRATGISAAALRDKVDARLAPKVFDALLQRWAEEGAVTLAGGEIRHPEAAITAVAAEEDAVVALRPIVEQQGLAPGTVDELAAEAGVDTGVARKALTKLALDREVVRLSGDLHFSRAAVDGAKTTVESFISTNGPATAAQLREALGVSRKYLIPLLEYFDAQGVTKREGDLRVLR